MEIRHDQRVPERRAWTCAALRHSLLKDQDVVAVDAAPGVLRVRDPLAGVSVSAVSIILPSRRVVDTAQTRHSLPRL